MSSTVSMRRALRSSVASTRIVGVVIAAHLALASSAAWAQPYPTKAIHIILPGGSGSPNDVRARQIAANFTEVFGQTLVVDNKPGANGFIAAEAAARSPADGYTLFMGNSQTHVYNPWLFRRMPYRDVEDFVPITLISGGPLILAVNAQLPVQTIGELIALAKAKPGELNYGIGGARGVATVVMEQIKRATGINVVGVPYKAPGADLTDTIAGEVSITFNFWAILEPLVKSGKLRALAVAAPTRLPAAPDLPTFAEAGVPGVELFSWNGLFAPAGTPRAVVDRLQRGFAQILHAPAFQAELIRSGSIVGGNSPEEFAAFWRADRARTGKALADAGIAPE